MKGEDNDLENVEAQFSVSEPRPTVCRGSDGLIIEYLLQQNLKGIHRFRGRLLKADMKLKYGWTRYALLHNSGVQRVPAPPRPPP